MLKTVVSLLALILVATTALTGCAATPAPITWRMATSWSDDIFFYSGGAKASATG